MQAAEDEHNGEGAGDVAATIATREEALLEEERAKHARRAEKFGVEYREPERRRDLRHVVRKEKALERAAARPVGFTPGLDLYSQEEIERRRQRAARFQTEDSLAAYQPAVDPADIARRKKRAERFGTEFQPEDAAGLMDVDLLEQKREVAPEVARRREAIHLYGVDLLNTKEVLSYFREYSPVYCEWLDDSSCNILFRDEFTAKRAIFGMGKPLPPEDIPEGQELAVVDVTQLEKLWHKGPDFEKDGHPIPLIFRVATVEDKRPPPGTHTTRRLWQAPGSKSGQQQQQRQQQRDATGLQPIEEGEEGRGRGRRRRRRADSDVEMQDAEEDYYEGDADDEGRGRARQRRRGDAAGSLLDDPERQGDAREQLRTRGQFKVTGLFSAAAAGITVPPRVSRQQRQASEEAPAVHSEQREAVSYADL